LKVIPPVLPFVFFKDKLDAVPVNDTEGLRTVIPFFPLFRETESPLLPPPNVTFDISLSLIVLHTYL
jgi:hypothetical protein